MGSGPIYATNFQKSDLFIYQSPQFWFQFWPKIDKFFLNFHTFEIMDNFWKKKKNTHSLIIIISIIIIIFLNFISSHLYNSAGKHSG